MGGRPYTTGEIRRAVELEARGLSQAEVARALGRPLHRLAHYLRLHGQPRPPARPGLAEREQSVRCLAAQGLCAAELARQLRVSEGTVRRWAKRLGLSLPSGRVGRPATEHQRERQAMAQSDRHRALCARLGWPEVNVPRHARILAYLSSHGPATHVEIAVALGVRLFARGRGAPQCPDLAAQVKQLMHLRMVIKHRRGYRVTYGVAPWITARRRETATS